MKAAKEALRAEAGRRREAARAALGEDAARLFADHFFASIKTEPSICLAGYAPIGSEADPTGIMIRAVNLGHACALPKVAVKQAPLVFLSWRPGDDLVPGAHGTREPSADRQVVVPDVVIVPLLAFDGVGRRLGYGGGYYDRTLAALRQARGHVLAVGVAFSAQEVEDLPEDVFDVRLDWIVTEAGARAFEAPPGEPK